MILESISVGPMEVNCYILACEKKRDAVIIDPGAQSRKIKKALDNYELKPGIIINTHGHYDHIGCDGDFAAPVYIHEMDAKMLKDPRLNLSLLFADPYSVKNDIHEVQDSQVIESDGIKLKVLHIPGHTPGGIALQLLNPEENIVFTGDTLFSQGIGRSDFEGGNEDLLINSIINKLLSLNGNTLIYPGHGPSSTIGREKEENPFLR